jgi:hypothetical protein
LERNPKTLLLPQVCFRLRAAVDFAKDLSLEGNLQSDD